MNHQNYGTICFRSVIMVQKWWTKDNPFTGVVFTITDDNLMSWIEYSGHMEPILASYFELIYITKPFQYKGNCIETRMLDNGDMEIITLT